MRKPLSSLERSVLDYLIEYLRRNTYQPSIREIGRRFDIKSTKTVSELLQALADKGWIERDPSRSRGVRLLGLEMRPETVSVPWYDGPGASMRAQPGESGLEAFELDRRIAGAGGTFMVAMADDSMANDGIRAGDLLLVEPACATDLDDGDIVVARLDGEVTTAVLIRRDDDALLQRGTVGPPSVRLRAGAPEVLGRVLSIVRRLRVPVEAESARDAVRREA